MLYHKRIALESHSWARIGALEANRIKQFTKGVHLALLATSSRTPIPVQGQSVQTTRRRLTNGKETEVMKHEATKLATKVNAQSPMEIEVSDVEELYAAVNDDNNVGKTIVLRNGVYELSRHDAGGEARLNTGRLELKRNMSLRGSDSSECVLKVSSSDSPVFNENPTARSGMIKTGLGNHTIEKLTVIAPPQAGSGISTDLVDLQSQETTIRIA